jgi:ParB family transcriptional regulator, chromosome partitioning protein
MTDANRKPRPGLGRGLSALLGDAVPESPVTGTPEAGSGVRMLPVSSLVPHPDQPRRHFDEDALEELAQSLKQRGLIQPIVVRPTGHNYQIVAGERRWRAAQRARLHEVPVIVRDFDDAQTMEIALVENIQRQDLNAIEEAEAYARLIREFGHSQEALGKLVHKSRSHIAMGHARALIGAPDAEKLARDVATKGLSVRETEKLARHAKPGSKRKADPKIRDADIMALEHQLGDVLGLNVKIAHSAKGGTLTLSYSTLDQLDMVCQRLSGERI